MPTKKDLTPEEALVVLTRQRRNNRLSAKRFRERMIAEGYWYLQVWVPEEAKDEVKTAVDRVVKRAEQARRDAQGAGKGRR
jgi:CRISPR/Cas system-associated protein endoribonuclease Cas2